MGPDLPDAHLGEPRVAEVDGLPVHYLDHGGSGPVLVLVHGLGGSSLDWSLVAPALAARARVVAVDLAGFGSTPSRGRPTSVQANAALLAGFVSRVFAGPAILMGNSMGGMVAMIAAATHADRVAGLVLVDPALPAWPDVMDPLVGSMFLAYAAPGVGEALLGQWSDLLGPEGLVDQTLLLCFADPARIPRALRDALVEQERRRWRRRERHIADFLAASRSITALLTDIARWRGILTAVGAPVLVLHGDRDRLVPVESARALAGLRPDWSVRVLEGVGHTPMIEVPLDVTAEVGAWLDGRGRAAVQGAAHDEALRPLT
jgi:pimeloyl-ACP methyl ester carboxylesterase